MTQETVVVTSLADALAEVQARKLGPRCTVAVVLGALPPADRDALLAAIADPQLSAERIAAACKAADIALGYSPISRHRRNGCDCKLRASE